MNINPAHWHLLLNHFPIILSITGTVLMAAALIFKKEHLKFSSTLLLIASGVTGFLAYQTGEGAEDGVRDIQGVSQSMIETHEEIAATGLTVVIGLGVLAFVTLLLVHLKKNAARLFLLITFIAAIGTSGLFAYIGYTGGEIRHSEIRGDFGGSGAAPSGVPGGGEEEDD